MAQDRGRARAGPRGRVPLPPFRRQVSSHSRGRARLPSHCSEIGLPRHGGRSDAGAEGPSHPSVNPRRASRAQPGDDGHAIRRGNSWAPASARTISAAACHPAARRLARIGAPHTALFPLLDRLLDRKRDRLPLYPSTRPASSCKPSSAAGGPLPLVALRRWVPVCAARRRCFMSLTLRVILAKHMIAITA